MTMYRGRCYRNEDIDKAKMFNEFFFEQFSDRSMNNIDIDWINDQYFDIIFCHK